MLRYARILVASFRASSIRSAYWLENIDLEKGSYFSNASRSIIQCKFLDITRQESNFTIYSCRKKNEIESLPANYGAKYSPAFGAGCCMSLFNSNRDAILAERD